ncbi:apicoplast pyruvate carrier 1-like [Convolutriloba macropyga]|uniref:apicoplast pyruvate carrier 1-like n=1 Tax=Convolutriloba macropyga TaxID=536237 RepID=UPI003F5258D6
MHSCCHFMPLQRLERVAAKLWRRKDDILGLIGITLILAVFGTVFSAGNISPYITSYLRFRTKDTWITYETSVWVFTSCSALLGVFAIVGGAVGNVIDSRFVILIGCALNSVGVLLSGWLIDRGFVSTLISFGVMRGVGIGVAYPLLVKFSQMWYPSNPGFATGVSVSGFGSGAFIVNFFQTALINPRNLQPDVILSDGTSYFDQKDVLKNVPKCLFILGSTYALLSILGFLLVWKRSTVQHRIQFRFIEKAETNKFLKTNQLHQPKRPSLLANMGIDNNEEPSCEHSVSEDRTDSRSIQSQALVEVSSDSVFTQLTRSSDETEYVISLQSSNEFTPCQVLKSVSYWMCVAVVCVHQFMLVVIQNYYKVYGETIIDDDSFLAGIGSFGSVANATGRIMYGLLVDATSYKTSMMTMSAFLGLLSISMPICSLLSGTPAAVKLLFCIYVCLMFFNLGGLFVMAPSAVGKAFGLRHFGVNYGMILTFSGFSIFGVVEVISALLEYTSWVCIFLIGGLASFSCQLFTLFWTKDNDQIN